MSQLDSLFRFPFSSLPFFGNLGWPPGHGGPLPGNGRGWNGDVREDYERSFSCIAFAPGETEVKASIPTLADASDEADEHDASSEAMATITPPAPNRTDLAIEQRQALDPTITDTWQSA